MSLYKRCDHKGRDRDNCHHAWWSEVEWQHRRVRVSLERFFNRHVRGRGSKTVARDLDRQLIDQVRRGTHNQEVSF